MSDVFLGDNDHGDRTPSTDVLLQMIKQLRTERDEARREACECKVHQQHDPVQLAQDRGWDCFKSDTLSQEVSQGGDKSKDTFDHKTVMNNSYKNIVNKHHNAFEKLAREKNNNG